MITANGVKFLNKIGIDVTELGVVMLKTEQLPIKKWVPQDFAYVARNRKRHWIKGLDVGSHLTLLYGLLGQAHSEYKEGVMEVLSGWAIPQQVEIEDIDTFDSPFIDEPYKCLAGRIRVTDQLLEGHQRLSLLPHINTYLEYKPHVTLGYVQANLVNEAIYAIEQHLWAYPALQVTGLEYGDRML
jgi:2'-5' RNA ligase